MNRLGMERTEKGMLLLLLALLLDLLGLPLLMLLKALGLLRATFLLLLVLTARERSLGGGAGGPDTF